MSQRLDALFGIGLVNELAPDAAESLQLRLEMPALLREAADPKHGALAVTIRLTPDVARRLADDLDFAVKTHPLGLPAEHCDKPWFP